MSGDLCPFCNVTHPGAGVCPVKDDQGDDRDDLTAPETPYDASLHHLNRRVTERRR